MFRYRKSSFSRRTISSGTIFSVAVYNFGKIRTLSNIVPDSIQKTLLSSSLQRDTHSTSFEGIFVGNLRPTNLNVLHFSVVRFPKIEKLKKNCNVPQIGGPVRTFEKLVYVKIRTCDMLNIAQKTLKEEARQHTSPTKRA